MAAVDPRSAGDPMWERESRFGRRAELVLVDRLTETGTVRLGARVTDNGPFDYRPGQFVSIQAYALAKPTPASTMPGRRNRAISPTHRRASSG